jgi:hypothetical protein
VVRKIEDGPDVRFFDDHVIHSTEVTSPAFRFKEEHLGLYQSVLCHCRSQHQYINNVTVEDQYLLTNYRALEEKFKEYGIDHWGWNKKNRSLYRGSTEKKTKKKKKKKQITYLAIVCGGPHTSTHDLNRRAFRWYGEMVLSAQCIMQ